jgi:hypothetical protein
MRGANAAFVVEHTPEGRSVVVTGRWGIRRLNILDRGIEDLAPIGGLGNSLEALSVQAAPSATLDLGLVPRLRSIAGE